MSTDSFIQISIKAWAPCFNVLKYLPNSPLSMSSVSKCFTNSIQTLIYFAFIMLIHALKSYQTPHKLTQYLILQVCQTSRLNLTVTGAVMTALTVTARRLVRTVTVTMMMRHLSMSRRLRRPPKRSTRKVSKCTPNVLTGQQCKDYNLINHEICNIIMSPEWP